MRRAFTGIFAIAAVLAAIAIGWFYESRLQTSSSDKPLEIPTDIDYFLAEVKYQTYNEGGSLDTQLNSPYMEHFPQGDISHLRLPVVKVYRTNGNWRVEAIRGELLHQQNIFSLQQDVRIKRFGENPMLIRSEAILIEPERDVISSDTEVVIETGGARISGDTAVFDLHNQIYSMKNTRAVYSNES